MFFWQIAADRLPDGTNPLQEASRKKLDRKHAKSALKHMAHSHCGGRPRQERPPRTSRTVPSACLIAIPH